jgi:Flp pilus assembly pilin Flp
MRGVRRALSADERGATSVEYALLLTVLALALIAGATAYGLQLGSAFATAGADIEIVGGGSGPGSQPPTGPGSPPPAGPGGQPPGGPANGGGPGNGGPGNSCQNPGNGGPPHCTP